MIGRLSKNQADALLLVYKNPHKVLVNRTRLYLFLGWRAAHSLERQGMLEKIKVNTQLGVPETDAPILAWQLTELGLGLVKGLLGHNLEGSDSA